VIVSELDAVRALMEADRWIDRVSSQRDHLPEASELTEVENELRGLAELIRELDEQRRPVRDGFNEAADRADNLRRRRDEVADRLASAAAPARELATMQTELDRLIGSLDAAEDLEVALMLDLEPLDERADDLRHRAAPLAKRRHELTEAITQLRASLAEEVAHLGVTREALAAALSAPLRRRYEAAFTRSGVSGAAQLDQGRCDGCRVTLSPLDLERFRASDPDQFTECPHCGRLLLAC